MHGQRGRVKRYREDVEKASRPNQIWATDLMYMKVGGVQYYLVTFIDEYSRYLVHWELLTSMDGHSISTAAQRAIETLAVDRDGKLSATPIIRCDNGSGYISGEFVGLLAHHELTHHRIRPHCPEENGVQERFNRTLREGIEEHDLESRYDSDEVIGKLIRNYNSPSDYAFVLEVGKIKVWLLRTWYCGPTATAMSGSVADHSGVLSLQIAALENPRTVGQRMAA